jgi:hypothetical protein
LDGKTEEEEETRMFSVNVLEGKTNNLKTADCSAQQLEPFNRFGPVRFGSERFGTGFKPDRTGSNRT